MFNSIENKLMKRRSTLLAIKELQNRIVIPLHAHEDGYN